MEILVNTVRVSGFRGLHNVEVNLEPTTVLTGMNNSGKTSFLKALQIALGNKQFVSNDDFYCSGTNLFEEIIIDIKIIPLDEDGKQTQTFNENWEILFTEERITTDSEGNSYIAIRTIVLFDPIRSIYKTKQFIIQEWPEYKNAKGEFWNQSEAGKEKSFYFEEMPFFFMDAQRDILEDMKTRGSYLGKMLSKIEYSKEDIKKIEKQIEALNEQAVNSSDILKTIKDTLKELDTAMDSKAGSVDITPFTKKIRDFNKGLSIYYSNNEDSFPMEYHGMGTRSWSSLLTLKSFITLLDAQAKKENSAFFPILAIEEPEAHLHPNAQKKLFSQISGVYGQKIISTHSPYIVAASELNQIRSIYSEGDNVKSGQIDITLFEPEDIRKIKRQVANTRGEMFFSKAIVFFEGETEEQALPILAEYFFKKPMIGLGIDFIGVGGHGNYLPFLRVAKSLNIPWFLFSDGEKEVVKSVTKTLKTLHNREIKITEETNVFILENDCDFEKQLIEDGFVDEIKAAFEKLHSATYLEEQIKLKDGTLKGRIKTAKSCDKCKQSIYEDILRNYSGDQGYKEALYDCMVSQKTQFGAVISDCIISSKKTLPPKIEGLFSEIQKTLSKEKTK